jgi:4a-hydroxytetrahydrobiopterin dehydratase
MNLHQLTQLKPTLQHKNNAFTQSEIESYLAALLGWALVNKKIQKEFTFKNYYETIAFVNVVAAISHQTDHHPDLSVHYSRCVVAFNTHDVENGKGGISINDFICAARIDAFNASAA